MCVFVFVIAATVVVAKHAFNKKQPAAFSANKDEVAMT